MITQCAECQRSKIPHYQDVLHGWGRRVFNALETPSGARQKYRCTVCLHEDDFTPVEVGRGEGKLKKTKGKKPTGKNPAKKERR